MGSWQLGTAGVAAPETAVLGWRGPLGFTQGTWEGAVALGWGGVTFPQGCGIQLMRGKSYKGLALQGGERRVGRPCHPKPGKAETRAEEPEKQIKTNGGKGQVGCEHGPRDHSPADAGSSGRRRWELVGPS